MDCSMPGFSILHQFLEFTQTLTSNHFILCCPLLLPSIFPSIRVLSSESALRIRWPKYWSISSSNEYSDKFLLGCTGLISFLSKRHSRASPTPQFKSINSSMLSLFYCPLPHPYMTTGKTIALTIWTFVGKVMSLFFNMPYKFAIAFLPRSKYLLISWLQSSSTVILEPKKIKSVTVSIVFPSICHEVMGWDAMIFIFWMLSFKSVFSLSSFSFIKSLFNSSSLNSFYW